MTMSDIDPKAPGPQEAPTLNLDQLGIIKGMLTQTNEAVKLLGGQLAQHAEDTKAAVSGIAQTMVTNHSGVTQQLSDLDRRMTVQEAWKVAQEGRADAASLRVASLTDELKKEQSAREELAKSQAAQTVMIQGIYKWTVDMSQKPMVQRIGKAVGALILLALAAAAGHFTKGSP